MTIRDLLDLAQIWGVAVAAALSLIIIFTAHGISAIAPSALVGDGWGSRTGQTAVANQIGESE